MTPATKMLTARWQGSADHLHSASLAKKVTLAHVQLTVARPPSATTVFARMEIAGMHACRPPIAVLSRRSAGPQIPASLVSKATHVKALNTVTNVPRYVPPVVFARMAVLTTPARQLMIAGLQRPYVPVSPPASRVKRGHLAKPPTIVRRLLLSAWHTIASTAI